MKTFKFKKCPYGKIVDKAIYAVLEDGELCTNIIDDMNSTESWGWGGMIFLNKKAVKDFIRDCKECDVKKKKYQIIELSGKPIQI